MAGKKYEKKINLKPGPLLAPVPVVLVSCAGMPGEDNEKPNLITIAWTGIVCSKPPMLSISVCPERYSHAQICRTKEFVVNLVDRDLVKSADYCGVKSGRDIDKFAQCRLTPVKAEGLALAPAVEESPLSLSCKVRQIVRLGSHDCIIGEIIAVSAATELMDNNGRLALEKAQLAAFCHGDYYGLDHMLGFFGYSIASNKVLERRMPQRAKPKPGRRKK